MGSYFSDFIFQGNDKLQDLTTSDFFKISLYAKTHKGRNKTGLFALVLKLLHPHEGQE